MKAIRLVLKRFADPALQSQVRELESQLEAEHRRLTVADAEIESLAAVVARDRERIKAEGACYARQRAEAEGVTNERDLQSTGRR